MAKTLGHLTVADRGRITIPREISRALGVDGGAHIRIDQSEDGVINMTPVESIPKDQLWFHTPEIQARTIQAEDDLASGRFHRTTGLKETQEFLDSLKSHTKSLPDKATK